MATNVVDVPAKANEDKLEMSAYGEALTEFISNAEAPLTIALQGEWGSGKTSLMNVLKNRLVDAPAAKFHGIWINTWQFAMLSDTRQTVFNILYSAISQVSQLAGDLQRDKIKDVAVRFAKVFGVYFGNVAGNMVGLDGFGTEVKNALDGENKGDTSAAGQVETLKKSLQELVDAAVQETKKRFVFFIDDLDRIDPPVAVEILELLKNIFDLRHCIFVLAIDYGVVVKGLKPKFGEMTASNEREFRSFFDKIIQLPFSMPVTAYHIDKFLLDSLESIGYLDAKDREDKKLCEALTTYALESVGTNPRSLKRLINTLSLIRLLILRTRSLEDDDDFSEWKDVSFALVCLQIQYPQIYSALESSPDFPMWDDKFAQSMRLEALSADDVERLKKWEEFDEPWEQMLWCLCKKDTFLEARALSISKILNQIKTRIGETKEPVGDIVECLLGISAVTNVKSEPQQNLQPVSFSKSDFLKALRWCTLNMRQTEEHPEVFRKAFSNGVLLSVCQKRIQSNLNIDLLIGEDYLSSAMFHIFNDGESFKLKIYGELWGNRPKEKFTGFDFTSAEIQKALEEVEETFRTLWSPFGVRGNIGHHDANIWFNVTIPFRDKDELVGKVFSEKLQSCIAEWGEAFGRLMPFRKLSVQ